jgi:hypothetical protein
MVLTIRSFNFRVGSLGSICLSDSIYSGRSASKTAAAAVAILETSVGSSREANSPVGIKPAESKKNIINPLDEIIENFNFKESLDQSDIGLEENSDTINNYSEWDFTARYGDVSYSSEDEWVSI